MYKSLLNVGCLLVLLASVIWGLIAWMTPAAGTEAAFRWSVRIGACILGPVSLFVLVANAVKADRLPDFLWEIPGRRFGRGGVIFAFEVASRDGLCWMRLHYQNRFDGRAEVAVLLMPSQGFLLEKSQIEPIAVQFSCGPAAYGIVSIPMAIGREYQGKQQSFDVGASVEYPEGTGELVRNGVGAPVSRFTVPSVRSMTKTVARVAIVGRPPFLGIPSRVTFRLPTGVREAGELPGMDLQEKWTPCLERFERGGKQPT
jgi:hypothetical protein